MDTVNNASDPAYEKDRDANLEATQKEQRERDMTELIVEEENNSSVKDSRQSINDSERDLLNNSAAHAHVFQGLLIVPEMGPELEPINEVDSRGVLPSRVGGDESASS